MSYSKKFLSSLILGALLLGCVPSKNSNQSLQSESLQSTEKNFLISPGSPVYLKVEKIKDDRRTYFNLQDQETYKVKITGLEVSIDQNQSLWKSLSVGNISEITIIADRILLKNPVKWPSAHVTITAREFVVSNGSFIDLTPSSEFPMLSEGLGASGKDGIPGVQLNLNIETLTKEENFNDPIFIVNGGNGQDAGAGKEGSPGLSVVPLSEKSFATLPAELKSIYVGHAIGIEKLQYKKIEYCSGNLPGGHEWKFECGKTVVNYHQEGTFSWPQNGEDALPAGAPGAGGPGGNVNIRTLDTARDWSQLITVNSGRIGKIGKLAQGGLPGTPQVAIIKRARNSGSENAVYEDEVFKTTAGKDAPPPLGPTHKNPEGTIKIEEMEGGNNYSLAFFKLKLNYIRDLFLSENYDEALNLVNDTIKLLPVDIKNFENNLIYSRLAEAKINLIENKTYFGESRMSVPFYSMDVSVQKLNSDIENHFNQMLFVQAIIDRQINLENDSNALKQSIDLAQKNSLNAYENLKPLISEKEILKIKIENLKNQKNFYENQLQQIIENLRAIANSKLAFDKEFERNKTIFIGALGALARFYGGSSVSKVFDLVQTVPLKGSIDDQLEWASKFKKALDEAKTQGPSTYSNLVDWFNSVDFTEIYKSEEFRSKLELWGKKFESMTFEEKLELLQQINQQKKKITLGLRKILDLIKESKVKDEELDKLIIETKNSDPQFREITKRMEQVNLQVEDLNSKLSEHLNSILNLTKIIDSSINLTFLSEKKLFKNSEFEDSNLNDLVLQMGQESEDNLLKTYYQLLSALRYSTLSEKTNLPDLYFLKSSIQRVLAEESSDKKAELLHSLYMNSLNLVKDKLFKSISTKQILRSSSVQYILSKKEKDEIAKTGFIRLDLGKSFYFNDKNLKKKIMISKVEIEEPKFTFKHARSTLSENSVHIDFRLEMDSFGKLIDLEGKSWIFDYSNLGSLNHWMAESNIFSDRIEHHQIPIQSKYYKNAINVLLGQNNTDVEFSNLFSQHAGYTQATLFMSPSENNFYVKLKSLSINFEYEYLE